MGQKTPTPDVASAAASNPSAGAWLHPHRGWLARFILSRLRHDPASADDVLQDVSLAAWRSPTRPQADTDLRNWLCRIAIRQCALSVRRRTRARQLTLRAGREPDSNGAAQVHDPIHWLVAGEDQASIRRAYQCLDENNRTLLTWKYLEHQTYRQIAARLGLTVDAAEYRVVKARAQLRHHLTVAGLGPEDPREHA